MRGRQGSWRLRGVGARAAEEVAEDPVCIEDMARDERRKVSLMPYRERWNSVCSICRRTTLSRPLINHFRCISPASWPFLSRPSENCQIFHEVAVSGRSFITMHSRRATTVPNARCFGDPNNGAHK